MPYSIPPCHSSTVLKWCFQQWDAMDCKQSAPSCSILYGIHESGKRIVAYIAYCMFLERSSHPWCVHISYKTHQILPSQQLLIQPQSIVFWTSDSMGCTDKSCCHPALAGIVSFQRPVLFPPMLCHTLEQVIMIINVSSIYFFFKSTSLEGKQ